MVKFTIGASITGGWELEIEAPTMAEAVKLAERRIEDMAENFAPLDNISAVDVEVFDGKDSQEFSLHY